MLRILRRFRRQSRLDPQQRLRAIVLKELLEYPGSHQDRLVRRIGARWGSEAQVRAQIETGVRAGLIQATGGSPQGLFLSPRGRDCLSELLGR